MTRTFQTKNTDWGFHGTSRDNFGLNDEQAADLYELVAKLLVAELMLTSVEAVVYLDARHGRHDADGMTWFGAKSGLSVRKLASIAAVYFRENGRLVVGAVRDMQESYPELFAEYCSSSSV